MELFLKIKEKFSNKRLGVNMYLYHVTGNIEYEENPNIKKSLKWKFFSELKYKKGELKLIIPAIKTDSSVFPLPVYGTIDDNNGILIEEGNTVDNINIIEIKEKYVKIEENGKTRTQQVHELF